MISKKITYNEANILVWDITETIDELKALLTNFEVYNVEFRLLNSEKRQKEFLVSRIALNNLIGKNVVVKYTEEGKPFIVGNTAEISITHSKNQLAVMLHPQKQVGIDLECPTPKIERVYKRFLSEQEQKQFSGNDEKKYWQLAWCAKEAMYKIIGKEAVDFQKDIFVLPFKIQADEGCFSAQHVKTETTYQLHYFITETYYLVFCINTTTIKHNKND